MYSRSKRNIPRVDYKLLNTVGFENKNMSGSEEDSTQSESGLDVASGSVPDSNGQNDDDNELSQLRDAVAKKEPEKKKLIEALKDVAREFQRRDFG